MKIPPLRLIEKKSRPFLYRLGKVMVYRLFGKAVLYATV
jgi:hypothetical protein